MSASSEVKVTRFKRIAEHRTNRILNDLRLLGNTANRNTYAYSDDQIDKIFDALEDKLAEVKGKFYRKSRDKFEL